MLHSSQDDPNILSKLKKIITLFDGEENKWKKD